MDLQTREITYGVMEKIVDRMYTSYSISELYTDGKEIYGVTRPTVTTGIEKGVVHLVFTDSIDDFGDSIIKVEYLTE